MDVSLELSEVGVEDFLLSEESRLLFGQSGIFTLECVNRMLQGIGFLLCEMLTFGPASNQVVDKTCCMMEIPYFKSASFKVITQWPLIAQGCSVYNLSTYVV